MLVEDRGRALLKAQTVKGTDVTAEELAHAEGFLRMTNNYPPEQSVIERDQLIRLLAWYGSIRAGGQRPSQLAKVAQA